MLLLYLFISLAYSKLIGLFANEYGIDPQLCEFRFNLYSYNIIRCILFNSTNLSLLSSDLMLDRNNNILVGLLSDSGKISIVNITDKGYINNVKKYDFSYNLGYSKEHGLIGVSFNYYNSNRGTHVLKYINHNITLYNFTKSPEIGTYEYIDDIKRYYISVHNVEYSKFALITVYLKNKIYYHTTFIQDRIYDMKYDNNYGLWLIQGYNETNYQLTLYNNEYIYRKRVLPRIYSVYSMTLYNNTLYITSRNVIIKYYIEYNYFTQQTNMNKYFLFSSIMT
jgi:hypothetical protein